MGTQGYAALPPDNARALVFTDARGQVVFVDNNFIKLTGRSAGAPVVGVPMHEILGIERDEAQILLKEISKAGELTGVPVDMRDAAGSPLHVDVNGVATYDDRKSFIGADLALFPAANGEATAEVPAPAAPASAEVPAFETERVELTHTYFMAQMLALRELAVRIGGERLRNTFNNIVNETATRSEWPIVVQDGELFAEVRQSQPEIFGGMLARMVTYAASMIGANLVVKEMAKIDGSLDAAVVDAGKSLGLSDLISGLK
jgi:hypothetical protein